MTAMRRLGLLAALAIRAAANDGDGSTPLLWAAYHDRVDQASRLLRTGANVNAANDLGATPLWAACQNGSATMVRALLDAGANPNAALLAGETPLMMAARTGRAEIAAMLLQRGANPNARGPRAQTALMWAAAQKHSAVVQALLGGGADFTLRSATWTDMMAVEPHGYLPYNRAIPHGNDTALLFAARSGDLESARLLVAAGANVNDADAWGVSALGMAAHSGYRNVVEFLLSKGADPNAAAAGFAPLHQAILQRDEAMVRALLAAGANPNLPLKTWTPTRRSSRDRYFHPSLVGASPYWLAARFLQPAVMRMLAERGADAKFMHHSKHVSDGRFEPRNETSTAIMAALGLGSSGPPAWVDAPAEDRETLTLQAVRIALAGGADVQRALDAAKAKGYAAVVQLLEDAGAR